MNDVLTMAEITERYAPDWVLILEPRTDEYSRVLGGRVAFHSPSRDAVYDKALELKPCDCAFRFLGEWPPEGMEFLL